MQVYQHQSAALLLWILRIELWNALLARWPMAPWCLGMEEMGNILILHTIAFKIIVFK